MQPPCYGSSYRPILVPKYLRANGVGKPGTPGRRRGQSCRTAGGRGHPFRTRLSPGAAEHLDSSWDRGDLWIAGLLCCFPSITVSMVIKVFVATSSGSTAVGGSFNFLLLLLGSGWGISLGDARKQPARDKKTHWNS